MSWTENVKRQVRYKIFLVLAMMAYFSIHYQGWHVMPVVIFKPRRFNPAKESRYLLNRNLRGPQNQPGVFWEEKKKLLWWNLSSYTDIILQCLRKTTKCSDTVTFSLEIRLKLVLSNDDSVILLNWPWIVVIILSWLLSWVTCSDGIDIQRCRFSWILVGTI